MQKIKIIGKPVNHSISPEIHNFVYSLTGNKGKYLFEKQEVDPLDLKTFFENFRQDPEQIGLTITIPHKVSSLKYLDKIDPSATAIGAVNTVIKKDNQLIGFNTDFLGTSIPLFNLFQKTNSALAFEDQFLKNQKVCLLGSGGASRAMGYAVLEKGADLYVFNRTFEKAKILEEQFQKMFPEQKIIACPNIQEIPFLEINIIINSTSIGLYPNQDSSPLDPQFLHKNQIVFDAVYKPKQTKFLKEAQQIGAETISGIEMFLYQAIKQIQIQTKIKLENQEDLLRQKIEELLK